MATFSGEGLLSRTSETLGTRDLSADVATTPHRTLGASGDFGAISRHYVRVAVAADALTGLTTFALTILLARPEASFSTRMVLLSLAGLVVWPLLVHFSSGYSRRDIGVGTRELRAVFTAGGALIVLLAYTAGLLRQDVLLSLVIITTPLCVLVTLSVRHAARQWLHRKQASGVGCRRTLAVGPSEAVEALRAGLAMEPTCGIKIQGACLPASEQQASLSVPMLGNLAGVREIVEEHGFEAVAVTGGECVNQSYLRRLAWSLEGVDVELLVAPGLMEVAGPRLHIRPVIGVPLLQVDQPRFTGWPRLLKRATDLVLTSMGLVLLAPMLVTVAVAIKLQDGGPVLFRQVRIGRDGQPFEMLKFRTMMVDAEARKAELMSLNEGHGGLFKLRNDPRVTRVGQVLRDWSIDELPQLVNVLRGSMSLVGPRPHLAHEIALMPPDAARRCLVTPGLTGLWQVGGLSDLSGSDGIRLDLRYVENWSLTLDLFILWKTVRAVLNRAGAR